MNKKLVFLALLFNLVILEISSFAQVNSLDFFINQGLVHSPVLKDIGNQVNSNTVDSLLVKAGQKPQVSYNGLLYYAPVMNGIGYSEVITNISNITSVAYASQRIFNQKLIGAEYSKLGIQNQALRISSKITENDLKKAIESKNLEGFRSYPLLDPLVFPRHLYKPLLYLKSETIKIAPVALKESEAAFVNDLKELLKKYKLIK